MRYIDTGTRDPDNALGSWLSSNIFQDASIVAIRWQTGFFGREPLGYFAPAIAKIRSQEGILRLLIGSNDGTTRRGDVEALLALVGSANSKIRVGVVKFDNAYFHPKTIHIAREDGSAAAYIVAFGIEEAVFGPVERRAYMWAEVAIAEQRAAPANDEDRFAFEA